MSASEVGAVVPELRFVTVVFVDLVGFTSLSESRAAEDVRELLGRYFLVARTIVERYGGVVEKFIGDAVMAVWGTPAAREDDAERAVRAALEIVDAVTVFGSEVGATGLRARAGVVTGQSAALENPGEGIVVGDRVNAASRLQSVAEPESVLVDGVTRELTSASILFEDAGARSVKGKAEPLESWRAVRVVAGAGGREREGQVEAPFVGRETELRLVKDLLHATVERKATRLAAISGEAGVGKSRLRRELSNYVDGLADTFLWHMGRCLGYGDGIAYQALGEMVRQRFAIAEDAPAQEVSDRLERGLREWIADPAERAFLTPRLGVLLGIAEPGLDRAELFAGWRLLFERLAAHEPVILVFEDLQWADQGLLDFIEQLLEWSTSVPILILTFARPELAHKRQGWPAGRRATTIVNLEPLDDAAMHELLAGVVDGLPRQASDRIVARAQGIPLYAIETVRGLADRGVLQHQDGRLLAIGELGELEVPATLTALLAARLDVLDPVQRTVVKAVSVFSGSFPREAALALTDVSDEQLDDALNGLIRRQVLVIRADPLSPDRGQYAFAQGMLRAVAYDTVARRERKHLHVTAAEHLTRVFANDGEEAAEVIATHLLDAYHAAGEDPDAPELRARAVAALRRAAQRAAMVGAPEAAQRAYLTASEHAPEDEQPGLVQAGGEMALQAGRVEQALGLLDRAAAAYAAAGQQREAALVAYPTGQALTRSGLAGQAAQRLGAALDTLQTLNAGAPDVAMLDAMLSRALVFTGDYERAANAAERALVAAEAHELPDVLVEGLINKAMIYTSTNRPQEAVGVYGIAVTIAESHELMDPLQRAVGNLGDHCMRWDLPDARRHIQATQAICRRRGDRYGESLDAGNLMELDLLAGRWEELETLARELLDADPNRAGAEYLHYRLVGLHALRGEPQAAVAALESLTAWNDSDDIEQRANHDESVAIARASEDKLEQALAHGLAALQTAIENLGPSAEAIRGCWAQTLHVALMMGRHDDARHILALLGDRPTGHVPPYLRAHLARGRALLDATEDRPDTVQSNLQAAIDTFAQLAYPYWQAVTQTDLADWHTTNEQPGLATPLLEQAISTLTRLRAMPALIRAQALTRPATTAT